MKSFGTFSQAIRSVKSDLEFRSHDIHTDTWQGVDVTKKPDAAMREIMNTAFSVMLSGNEDIEHYRHDIQPNIPWSDDHFTERVDGFPFNPGETWKTWPWALSADKFRTEGKGFTHTYMERYWPKMAGNVEVRSAYGPNHGTRYPYGDLSDVIELLHRDPHTRQAYLPIFFPEDTGAVHKGRIPCSLGHQFILRHGFFHSTYFIRSCDFTRHFRDDLYLSLRLQLWVLNRLRKYDPEWKSMKMGMFTFHCVSMHMFINDWNKEFKS